MVNRNIVGRIEVIEELLPGEWKVAYDLARDEETVALVQRATLTTRDFGVVPDVALFGSNDWWMAIRDGRIQKHVVSGTISRLFMTGHGDWPEFELNSGGAKSNWTRVGDQGLYAEGKEARVEYILQKPRRDVLGRGERKQVLRVVVKT